MRCTLLIQALLFVSLTFCATSAPLAPYARGQRNNAPAETLRRVARQRAPPSYDMPQMHPVFNEQLISTNSAARANSPDVQIYLHTPTAAPSRTPGAPPSRTPGASPSKSPSPSASNSIQPVTNETATPDAVVETTTPEVSVSATNTPQPSASSSNFVSPEPSASAVAANSSVDAEPTAAFPDGESPNSTTAPDLATAMPVPEPPINETSTPAAFSPSPSPTNANMSVQLPRAVPSSSPTLQPDSSADPASNPSPTAMVKEEPSLAFDTPEPSSGLTNGNMPVATAPPDYAPIQTMPKPAAGRETVVFPITIRSVGRVGYQLALYIGVSRQLDACIRGLAARKTKTNPNDWALVGVSPGGAKGEIEARYAGFFVAKDTEGINAFREYVQNTMTKDIAASCNIEGIQISASGMPAIAAVGPPIGLASRGINAGVITGATVGGIIVLVVLVSAMALFVHKRRNDKRRNGGTRDVHNGSDQNSQSARLGSPGLRFVSNRQEDASQSKSQLESAQSPEMAGSEDIRDAVLSQEGETMDSSSYHADAEDGGDADVEDEVDEEYEGEAEGDEHEEYAEDGDDPDDDDEEFQEVPNLHALPGFSGAWDPQTAQDSDEEEYEEGEVNQEVTETAEMMPLASTAAAVQSHDYVIGMGPVAEQPPLPPRDYVVPDLGKQD